MKLTALAVLALSCQTLSGCSGSLLGLEGRQGGWIVSSPPRGPQDYLEDAVIKAALTGEKNSWKDSDIYPVTCDKVACYIAVIGKTPEADRFAEKQVVRYRIKGGKIAAKTGETYEIFPDVEFERAVLLTAVRTRGDDPVTLYDDKDHSVALAGRLIGECTVEVSVFEADLAGNGQPIAVKKVTGCFQDSD
jgi:hypothetical protein